jgi:GNAT superfamily N-acetyltransferase
MVMPDGYVEVPAGKIAAVVTSLEMLARPPLRPSASDTSWALRHVTDPDPAWFRDLFRRVGQDWLWFSRLRMSDTALAEIICDPRVEVHALAVENADEGLVELDFRRDGECELSFFGLTTALTGRGAGRWLMSHAITLAWSRPIRRFWVHTCTLDHPSALPFYVRSGFKPFRRQIEIADDPRISGVLPRSAAAHIPVI